MAVKVIISTVYPPSEPEQGKVISGTVTAQLVSDYLSPAPISTSISVSYNEKRSRNAAVRRALKKIEELGNQLAEGARKAMEEHPIGG